MLSVATANLNTRVRNKGFSARELWTQRGQFTNEQLPLTDYNLIRQQHALRNANHAHSQLSKSPDGARPKPQHIDVGDIVYIYADRNKTRSLCRYIVVSTDGSWLNISKFIGTQLRATSYRWYKVVANTPDSTVTYEYEDEINAPIPDDTPKPLPSIPAQLSYPALPDEAQPVQPAPQHLPLIARGRKIRQTNKSFLPSNFLGGQPECANLQIILDSKCLYHILIMYVHYHKRYINGKRSHANGLFCSH